MAIIDTLKLARALRDQGGMSGPQAEAVSAALADAFTDQVATKADIDRLDAKIDALRVELKGDIEMLRVELKGDIETLRSELRGDTRAFRADLKGDIDALRAELKGDIGQLAARLSFQQWQLSAILAVLVALLVKLVVLSH